LTRNDTVQIPERDDLTLVATVRRSRPPQVSP